MDTTLNQHDGQEEEKGSPPSAPVANTLTAQDLQALFTALQQVKESPKYQRGGVVLTWEEERAKSLGIDFYY